MHKRPRRNMPNRPRRYEKNASQFFYILYLFVILLQDAELIRRSANETKVAARKLRDEADQLNHRVTLTERDITQLEENSTEDDNLVDDAKRKVGQAKADMQDAQKQIEKANSELSAIKDELENLRDINTSDLDKLGKPTGNLSRALYN